MSDEENKRLFDHYTNVSNGNVKSGNSVRDDLNVSDAKRHLADLIKKNPNLVPVVEKPKEEPKPIEEPKEEPKPIEKPKEEPKPVEKPKSKENK